MKHYLMGFLLSVSVLSWGQTFDVEDGDSVDITLSKKDVSKITVAGAGRISKVRGAEGVMEVNADKTVGEIFVRPVIDREQFSFFVSDSFGNSYTMMAKVADIPSQTIVLKPKKTTNDISDVEKRRYKELPLQDKVKDLVRAMALDSDLGGYDVYEEEKPIEIKRWKEVYFAVKKTYEGSELKGEIFYLRNITKQTLQFHENEFLDVGKGVVAAAVAKMDLEPNEMTYVYVVKRNAK